MNQKLKTIFILAVILCFITPKSSLAQYVCVSDTTICNYIANGGFEENPWKELDPAGSGSYIQNCNDLHFTGGGSFMTPYCPFKTCNWYDEPVYWGNTPDYFNSCAGNSSIWGASSVNAYDNFGSNSIGSISPHSGDGYTGIYIQTDNNNSSYYEFIVQDLKKPLVIGKNYIVGMWIRLSHASRYAGSFGADICGNFVTFTTSAVTDKNNWTYISTCFTPSVINNNKIKIGWGGSSVNLIDLQPTPNTWIYDSPSIITPFHHESASYYYIDDVSIKPFNVNSGADITKYPNCSTSIGNITPNSFPCLPAGATVSYNWSPSIGLSSTNTATTIASNSVTTTYTVSATVTFTNEAGILSICSSNDAITVYVASPTLSITASENCNSYITNSFTATVLPIGAQTYSWTVKDVLTNTVIPITGTGTNSAYPTFNFQTISSDVYVCAIATNSVGCKTPEQCYFLPTCCQTPTNSLRFANTTFSATKLLTAGSPTVVFGGTITINSGGNLYIKDKNVYIEPNTKFVVNGTGNVSFINSYVHGCNAMWDGIYVNTTNGININNSRVEDAKRVVIDSLGTASINVVNSCLNRNNMGIVLKATKTSASNLMVKNTLFTCSNIPLNGYVPYIPLLANLSNAPTLAAFTSTVMLPPLNTQKSYCGINMTNASHTGKVNSAITIGGVTNEENVFDKMQLGIYSYDSKSNIQNNVFQNIKSTIAPNSYVNSAIELVGPIFTNNGSYMNVGGSLLQKNVFINNDYGIYNILKSTLLAAYNTFSVQTTGVYITSNNNRSIANVNFNNFYKNKIGVNYYNNSNISGDITNNNFDNSTAAVGDYTTNFAIRCTESVLGTNPATSSLFNIFNNNINGYFNGLYISQTLNTVINDNEIHLRQDNGAAHWQYGIRFTNTNNCLIRNNIADMTSLTTYAYWQIGISGDINQVPKVSCNSINNLCISMAFSNGNQTTAGNGIIGNYMQNASYGVWLVNNGEIGNQAGSALNNSADNAWANTCSLFTYAQSSSNGSVSKFFTRSGGGYDLPYTKSTKDGSPFCNPMFGSNNSATGSFTCNINTSTPSNAKLAQPPLTSLMQTGENIADDFKAAQTIGALQVNSLNLGTQNRMSDNQVNINAINRHNLLSNIVLQKIDVQSSASLTDFMTTVKSSNTGLLYAVDSLIHNAEQKATAIALAKNANATVVPLNNVEQSNQVFNKLYIDYLAQDKMLNKSQIIAMETIAVQCPSFYGYAVFQARAVLFDITKQSYRNECENVKPSVSSKRLGTSHDSDYVNDSDIQIYPNPANNQLFVNSSNYTTVIIKLYNIMGELVLEKTITNTEGININTLASGLYTYKIYSNTTELKLGKIVITH